MGRVTAPAFLIAYERPRDQQSERDDLVHAIKAWFPADSLEPYSAACGVEVHDVREDSWPPIGRRRCPDCTEQVKATS
jgi:hypothetical protein